VIRARAALREERKKRKKRKKRGQRLRGKEITKGSKRDDEERV